MVSCEEHSGRAWAHRCQLQLACHDRAGHVDVVIHVLLTEACLVCEDVMQSACVSERRLGQEIAVLEGQGSSDVGTWALSCCALRAALASSAFKSRAALTFSQITFAAGVPTRLLISLGSSWCPPAQHHRHHAESAGERLSARW